MLLGMGVNAEDAYLILRNLPNMAMRYSEQDKSARIIARWLKEQVQIEYILHPAFTDCPGHQFWQRDFSAAASLFSVVFKKQYTQNTIDQFLERLQLFKLGFSWGGMHSLCIPYAIENTRQHWPEEWKDKSIVRFYVGMEDSQDLIQDLQVALSTL